MGKYEATSNIGCWYPAPCVSLSHSPSSFAHCQHGRLPARTVEYLLLRCGLQTACKIRDHKRIAQLDACDQKPNATLSVVFYFLFFFPFTNRAIPFHRGFHQQRSHSLRFMAVSRRRDDGPICPAIYVKSIESNRAYDTAVPNFVAEFNNDTLLFFFCGRKDLSVCRWNAFNLSDSAFFSHFFVFLLSSFFSRRTRGWSRLIFDIFTNENVSRIPIVKHERFDPRADVGLFPK